MTGVWDVVLPEARSHHGKQILIHFFVYLHLRRVVGKGHTANAMKVIQEKLTGGFGKWATRLSSRQTKPPEVEASGMKENILATRAGHTESTPPPHHYQGHGWAIQEGKL